MKKILLFTFILFWAFSQNIFAENIGTYEVDIEIQKNAVVKITENINYDFGVEKKHGIFRYIPLYFKVANQGPENKKRKITISNIEVYRDGKKENITEKIKEDSNGNFYLKIGKKNFTMSGKHKYTIKYAVGGSLRYFKDFDEVY